VTKPRYEKRLHSEKGKTTLEALFRAARLANECALVRVRARQETRTPVRASHTALFPHIDLEGTRISTLAERVGVSKQAVSELVEELDEMGVVERVADPSDGRAKLVVFTKKGRNSILDGLRLLQELEGDLAARVGKRKMLTLRKLLHELIPLLEETE
jgi:DNA-binding MarR family transcriptional regulator